MLEILSRALPSMRWMDESCTEAPVWFIADRKNVEIHVSQQASEAAYSIHAFVQCHDGDVYHASASSLTKMGVVRALREVLTELDSRLP